MSDIVTPELEFVLELHGVLAQPMVMGETPARLATSSTVGICRW